MLTLKQGKPQIQSGETVKAALLDELGCRFSSAADADLDELTPLLGPLRSTSCKRTCPSVCPNRLI